jgi:hypothetical protein
LLLLLLLLWQLRLLFPSLLSWLLLLLLCGVFMQQLRGTLEALECWLALLPLPLLLLLLSLRWLLLLLLLLDLARLLWLLPLCLLAAVWLRTAV